MARQIFRKEALERLSSPEQLDQLMQVTNPRAWIALAAVGLLLLTTAVWGVFGTIPTTVDAPGVLVRRKGIQPLLAPTAGVVTRIVVVSGDGVDPGQELLRLAPSGPGTPEESVGSPFAARVLQRSVREGDKVAKGDTLMLLESLAEPLQARLFVPISEGYKVQAGMPVRVWPAQVERSEYGYLVGQVRGTAKFPISQEEAKRIVQSDELARQLTGAGPSLQVFVDLTPDPGNQSGYRWSSSQGAPVQLYSGTPCQARVILGEQRPIQLVLPALGGGRGP
jgi:hypothetical protein